MFPVFAVNYSFFTFEEGRGMRLKPVKTPEPSTWAMMTVGFAGIALASYRPDRRARVAPTLAPATG